ncbi:uncharacterized protein LOC110278394 [Arachis duranensis]|uniref:Uncharacterized protein LOC110278394 n=1 Tax=Arachis duranensis TaxID=130453 RepID=A0A9C6TPD5_ARADU|nr:uncharacterized protein LOC110278394 [Arachis duranensis]
MVKILTEVPNYFLVEVELSHLYHRGSVTKLSPSLASSIPLKLVVPLCVVTHHHLALNRAHAPFLSSLSSAAEAAGPELVIVVAPCLVTVSHSIQRLCCHCCARRRRRQKQLVPGLIVVVVFLLRLSPSASSSPSASFTQPEAGLQFACAFESNEKICQQNLPAKVKVAKAPNRLKIPHVHCCNTSKQL